MFQSTNIYFHYATSTILQYFVVEGIESFSRETNTQAHKMMIVTFFLQTKCIEISIDRLKLAESILLDGDSALFVCSVHCASYITAI